MTPINLSLTTRVITKKNNKRWIYRGGRKFLAPSAAYETFATLARLEISRQCCLYKSITEDVSVEIEFNLKGKTRGDVDNLATSILDILQDARVIEDDNQVRRLVVGKHNGAKEFHTNITISEIDHNILRSY